ncbi:MAG TPA: hypothetical protein PK413_01395 [Thermoanaerobaculia bacterium]|nr:hypothetical protein [Thermoanaerobaculia bacterium]
MAQAPELDGAIDANSIAEELVRRPKRQRALLLGNSQRAARLEVVEHLLERSRAQRHSSPAEARNWAEVAVEVAFAIHLDRARLPLLHDLKADALSQLANAYRLLERYRLADRTFARAEAWLGRGSGDALLAARLARMKGSLRRDQRRFKEAIQLQESAAALFEALQDPIESAQVQLSLTKVHFEYGDLERAERAVTRAVELLPLEAEPRLFLFALHWLAEISEASGQIELARVLVRSAAPFYLALADGLLVLRFRWLQGRLLASFAEWRAAVAELEEVRRGFLAEGLLYDASLVSLELALAHAELREPLEVLRLSREMLHIFSAKQIPREAGAAFLLFAQAAQELRADAELMRGLVRQMRELARRGLGTH